MTIHKALLILMLLMLVGCTSHPAPEKLRVAVSVYPLYDLARQVAGPGVEVLCLVPPGANPHTYEPRPSDLARLEHVSLFIGVSPDFDRWVLPHLPESATRCFLGEEEDSDEGHVQAEEHEHHGNPHIWLSVRHAKALLTPVAEALKAAPGTIQTVRVDSTALAILSARLDSLDQAIAERFQSVPQRAFIQWHAAWDGFAADYDLEIAGTLEHGHGDEPSVRDMADLVASAQSKGVKTVVVGLNVQSQAAEALAREIGGVVLRLDTLGDPADPERSTYVRLMDDNARKLARALASSVQ